MGDVIGLTKANGEVFAAYVYDEWGSLLSIQTIDSVSQEDLAAANSNPLRYRGYYYDTETGYYYLQSCYYDPSICRFINSDSFLFAIIHKDSITGTNLFICCYNDSINNSDKSGFSAALAGSAFFYYFFNYVLQNVIIYGTLIISGVLLVYLVNKSCN